MSKETDSVTISLQLYDEMRDEIKSLREKLIKSIVSQEMPSKQKKEEEDTLTVYWGKEDFDKLSLNDQYEEIHQEIKRLTNEEGIIWAKLYFQQVDELCRQKEELRKKK